MHMRLSHENVKRFSRTVVFDISCGFVALPRPVIAGGLFVFFSMSVGSHYFFTSRQFRSANSIVTSPCSEVK